MFFLLRMAFWLCVVLVLLPSSGRQRDHAARTVNASAALSAASATVGDLKGFCTRQPSACTVGSQLAAIMGDRAEAGAKMLYGWLAQSWAPRTTGSLPGEEHRAGLRKPPLERNSQDTLTPADHDLAWRTPRAG
ncbi:MAG: DUF5330 domain-containing protein [Xanthobacteraceae bacterium]